jgi:hypothetical protein
VLRLLSSLRIALVSNNKTLVEDLAKAFAGIGISKMQSYSVSSIDQAFEGVNITILDLDATKAFLKNKELVKRVFWSGKAVVFLANGVADPVEEIFKNLNRSELPLLVIPVKGVKKVNGVEIPIYGFAKIPQVVAIRIERVEKVENNKTYIGGLAPHYYVVHEAKNVREAMIKALERMVADLYEKVVDYSRKPFSIGRNAFAIIAYAQTDYTSPLDTALRWFDIGSMWIGGASISNVMTTDNFVRFSYTPDTPVRFYRVLVRHGIYTGNGWYLSNEVQFTELCAGTYSSDFSCNTVSSERFSEFYPNSGGIGGDIITWTITIGPISISIPYEIPGFITYSDPFAFYGARIVSWMWTSLQLSYGWMYVKAYLRNDGVDPTYFSVRYVSTAYTYTWLGTTFHRIIEAHNFALYPTNWQWYGSIFEVKS